jgi:hypothetical protein
MTVRPSDCDHFPCALDAPCAPWNDDLPLVRVSRFTFMRRYIGWLLNIVGGSVRRLPPPERAYLWWMVQS